MVYALASLVETAGAVGLPKVHQKKIANQNDHRRSKPKDMLHWRLFARARLVPGSCGVHTPRLLYAPPARKTHTPIRRTLPRKGLATKDGEPRPKGCRRLQLHGRCCRTCCRGPVTPTNHQGDVRMSNLERPKETSHENDTNNRVPGPPGSKENAVRKKTGPSKYSRSDESGPACPKSTAG